jgi:HEAT repeat protein
MTMLARNIRVAFIASPDDVADEREAAKEVIQDLNKSLRKNHWQIDIVGWEDTAPGVGRPQELINKDLDACDIFIGILWRRWGSQTGKYSSGFEEEFERAIGRASETGSPQVWLAFKQIDPEFLKDAGEQLQKVIVFRQKQIEQKQVLYHEFSNIEQWKSLLRNWVLEYVFSQSPSLNVAPESAASAGIVMSSSEAPQQRDESDKSTIQPARDQVIGILNAIESRARQAGSNDMSLGTESLEPFDIVRHLLLSTTLMSLQMQSTMLGVHEVQKLYLYRQRLELLQAERMLIFRMLLNDDDGLVPGWYWSTWLDEEMLQRSLFYFAFRDRNVNVRIRARELLASARIPPPEDLSVRETYLKAIASDESPHVRKAGVGYLGAVGDRRDLPTIKKEISEWLIGQEATVSRLLVLARTSPAQVLTESINQHLADKDKVISELSSNVDKITNESLLLTLRSSEADEDFKVFAIEELQRRGELTGETAASLLDGSKGRVAELCYRRLIDQGQRFPVDDIYLKVGDDTFSRQYSRDIGRNREYADSSAVILEMYKTYSAEELWALVDWNSEFGYVGYKALALYLFAQASGQIRKDLDEDFASYESNYLPAAVAKWKGWYEEEASQPSYRRGFGFGSLFNLALHSNEKGEERTPEASAQGESDGIKRKYIAAALAGIIQNGEANDVHYGRKYLSIDDYDVRVEAVKLIEQFGDEDDNQALIDLAKKTEGILQELAAKAALKHSSEFLDTAAALLPGAKEDLAGIVVQYLLAHRESAATREFMERMLLENSDVVRRKSIAFFAQAYEQDDLESLLDRYIAQPTYYYDVICWLDRILYAPAQLKAMFLRQLETELPQ